MTPRDIQLRIRSGESLADVIAASGLPADRVEAFATPILAEREHTTSTALASPVRRRGETASARRLRQTVAEALLDRGQDIDYVTWDSWRRSDGRWIIQGTWTFQGQDMCARYLFDPKGRFSIAENDQARVLIGDLVVNAPVDTETEPTIKVVPQVSIVQSDLGEETTLGYARAEQPPVRPEQAYVQVEEEESFDFGHEDSLRSDIDLLYDMISTIDEDSVRIFRGLREPLASEIKPHHDHPAPQPALIEQDNQAPVEEENHPPAKKSRKRASVPSWDDIIFGGQS